MLNVNAITSTLAKMPDAALQKYAALHKEDPYIMALAVSESNRRKQMRNAAQAPQGMPEPPKVADQAVAEMAPQMQQPMPEDVGIGQLPAGDMNFAGGGIIAFGDGGEVERYQVGGDTRAFSQFLREAGVMQRYINGTPAVKAVIENYFNNATQGPTRPTPAAAPAAASGPSAAPSAAPSAGRTLGLGASRLAGANVASIPIMTALGLHAAMEEMRAQGYPVDTVAPEFATEATPAQLAFDEDRRRKAIAEMSREDKLRKFGTDNVNQAVQGTANTSSAPAAAPTAPPGVGLRGTLGDQTGDFPMVGTRRPPTAPAAPRPAAAPTAPPGVGLRGTLGDQTGDFPTVAIPSKDDLQRVYQDILNRQEYKDPAEKEVAGLQKLMKEGAERRIKEFDADVAKRGDVFKGREERLAKREAEIGAQREENTGLALLNAGLAIMSTPGGLATALGKGARVGTEQFAAGLDKIRSAQAKLSEARDNLEELRINREDLTAKERRGLTAAADTAMIEAEKLGIDGLRTAGNIRRETAKDIFGRTIELTKTQLEQAGQDRRNAATVAGGIQQARIMAAARADGDNALARLYETTRNNIVKAAEGIYGAAEKAAFIEAEMRKAIQQNPALAQYVGIAGGGGAPAAAATHRLNPATGKIEPVR